MYPFPAVAGENLILRCLVWGTDQITYTLFYKDNEIIQGSTNPSIKISDVTEVTEGLYKCDATFTYKARTEGQPYKVASDAQDLFVQGMNIQPAWSLPLLCDTVCFTLVFFSPAHIS